MRVAEQESEGPSDDTLDDGGDDGVAEEFAREWEALRDKVARIPDDIGDKLDQLLHLGGGQSSHANVPSQTGQAAKTGRRANPYPTGESGAGAGVPHASTRQPDSKPETRHWYYRPLRRDK